MLLAAAWVAWNSRDLDRVDDADLRARALPPATDAPGAVAWSALVAAGADEALTAGEWEREVAAILGASQAIWIPIPTPTDEHPVVLWSTRTSALLEEAERLQRDGADEPAARKIATLYRLAGRVERATGAAVLELASATSMQRAANDVVEGWLEQASLRPEAARALLAALERDGLRADVAAELIFLEARLRDRGALVRAREAEVHRLGGLVRDLVEELEEHRRGRRAGTAAPAASADPEAEPGLARALAESRGRARGLAARLAEVAELRELAEARVALLSADLEGAEEKRRTLEARLAETHEELELALIKARGATTIQGHASPERVDELAASERRLAERVSALSGQLVAAGDLLRVAEDDRDRARAETLRLTAQLSALETRLEGHRLGYERRIAELAAGPVGPVAPAPVGESSREAQRAALRGENAGLELRLRDVEASLRALRGRRGEAEGLASQLADAQAQLAARDGLVARLQRDLAAEEQALRASEGTHERLRDETARLREAVVAASAAVDARESAERRAEALQAELTQALERAGAGEVRAEHAAALEQELAEAQARLASLERLGEEVAELRDRVAEGERLLSRAEEREAAGRHALAESRALLSSLREGAMEARPLRATAPVEPVASESSPPGESPALAEARARASMVERDLDAARAVFAETRAGLEELLGRATTRGDAAAAERLGQLLEALGRH